MNGSQKNACQLLSIERVSGDDDGPAPVPPPRSSSTLGRHSGSVFAPSSMTNSVSQTTAGVISAGSGNSSVLRVGVNKPLPKPAPAMSPVEEYCEPMEVCKSAARPVSMLANGMTPTSKILPSSSSNILMQTSNMEKSPSNTVSSNTATLESNKQTNNETSAKLNTSTDMTEDDEDDGGIENEEPIMMPFQPNLFQMPNKRMTLVDTSTSETHLPMAPVLMNASMYDIGSSAGAALDSTRQVNSPSSPQFHDLVLRSMMEKNGPLHAPFPWPKSILNVKSEDKDVLAFMSFTQSVFKKRILSATEKSSAKNHCEDIFKRKQESFALN
ncbi:hypothetical protein Ciccas_006006 [Cichlidogyrus casuarinus]|uniref:Uncharacterized protein n=1 Tax=Cichlidogyrus casuarinus TaxID=1844966 RepID=A0ABD2Q715_9PLAT